MSNSTTPAVPTVTLNNGVAMPILGFGVFQVAPDETERVVNDALEVGYRHLDTAAVYGNEEAVGRAIAASGIARDELFITTKLWVHDGGEAGTRAEFEASLERLGLDKLDLYLIHQPYGDVYASWRGMEAIYAEGLTRAIGVSNFHPDRLVDIADHNAVVPAVNQIEVHPFFQRADYQALMVQRGIQLEAWGPLAEGRNDIFTNELLAKIGAPYGKSIAQVALRWLTQRGVVAIPKSVRAERMAENLNIFDFELTADEMAAIAAIDTDTTVTFDHRDPEMTSRLGNFRLGSAR